MKKEPTTRVGWTTASCSTLRAAVTNGRLEVRRSVDPLDFATAIMGQIVVSHEFGTDGIGLSAAAARELATVLVQAADQVEQLNAEAKGRAS